MESAEEKRVRMKLFKPIAPDLSTSSRRLLPRRDCLKQLIVMGLVGLDSKASLGQAAGVADNTALKAFMAVSQQLTAKAVLSVEVGERLLLAFTQLQPNFALALLPLQQALQANTTLNVEQLGLKKQILQAWYTGLVNDQVVVYERALMFEAVKPILPIRSYCQGKPGFWARKPDAARV